DLPLALAATAGPEGQMRHPTFGLWPVALRNDLRQALSDGTRKVTQWADQHGVGAAVFPAAPVDPFFNINTPADLDRAAVLAASLS
ncbi:molybdenum cofactor guanylyltransferase MobA, partial [Pseudooceanicola lipolyticus]